MQGDNVMTQTEAGAMQLQAKKYQRWALPANNQKEARQKQGWLFLQFFRGKIDFRLLTS